jgi:hypothetical protein
MSRVSFKIIVIHHRHKPTYLDDNGKFLPSTLRKKNNVHWILT